MSQRKIKKERLIKKVDLLKDMGVLDIDEEHSIVKIIDKGKWFILLMLFGIFLIFMNALKGDFVSDDYAMIMNNQNIKNISLVFKEHYPNVSDLTNSVLANLFGVSPIVYHSYSIFLYGLICVVAYIFLSMVIGEFLAKIATVFFVVLPVHVEAVSWNSGKPYLYVALFSLIIMISLIKYLDSGKRRFFISLVIALVLGYFSDYARIFGVFPLIILYLISVNRKDYWARVKKLIPVVVISIIGFLIFIAPKIVERINSVNGGYNGSDSIYYNPFFQYPTGISKYLQLFWMPFDLTLYHTMYVFPVWLNWLILLNYFAILVYSFWKDKRIFFGLSFFLVALLPSMAPVKVSWLVAERYGFLPSLGYIIFLVVVLEYIWRKNKYLSVILATFLIIFYTERTYLRNIDWQTNHKLWVNTCQVSPNSHNAWNNIGDDYDKLKDYDNAIKGFTQSTVIKPNYADAYHNRANIFFKIGRLDLARDSYNIAVTISPSLFQTYLSLTQIDLMENKLQLAYEHASTAVKQQPNNPQSLYILGIVYAQAGNLANAEQIFKQILINFPEYKPARDALLAIGSKT